MNSSILYKGHIRYEAGFKNKFFPGTRIAIFSNGDIQLKRFISNGSITSIQLSSFKGSRLKIKDTNGHVDVVRLLRNHQKFQTGRSMNSPASRLAPLLEDIYRERFSQA